MQDGPQDYGNLAIDLLMLIHYRPLANTKVINSLGMVCQDHMHY